MFSIFSTDFNQSSACRGFGELAKVGGLWLINFRCLSRGGSGGGGGGNGACCYRTTLSCRISSFISCLSWRISWRSYRICACISAIVLAIYCSIFIWAATTGSVSAGGGFGGFISACCLSTLQLCGLVGRSILPPFLVLTIWVRNTW
jgi:hypothetical protein